MNTVKQINFNNAEILLKNPDRGLRMETYVTLGSPLYSYPLNSEDPYVRAENMIEKYRPDSPTICQVYVYLSNYTDKKLDDLAFSQLKKFFELFREHDIRILLRFAYATESTEDAPYETVKKHISQLKDWFVQNSDLINSVLYCLQTGIIGYWGEGHTYTKLEPEYIGNVISDICELAPHGIYTQVRTYDLLKKAPSGKLGKIGIHDDYIIGDMNDKWSFIPSSHSKEFNETVNYAKNTVNDGEMPWGYATLSDKPDGEKLDSLSGKNILKQLYTYSITTFSLEHNYRETGGSYSMEKWKNSSLSVEECRELGITVNPNLFKDQNGKKMKLSIFDIIRYHLGYQLAIESFSQNGVNVSVSLTNYGFSAPLNFYSLAIICKSSTNDSLTEIKIPDYNRKLLQSGKTIVYKTVLPTGLNAVGIKLKNRDDGNICVRFANSTEYKNGVQYFK